MESKNIEEKLDLILKEVSEIRKHLQQTNPTDDRNDEELFEEAKRFALQAGKISAAALQRKLKIGFAKAAAFLDKLEEEGVIKK